jgi:hypothetical protein
LPSYAAGFVPDTSHFDDKNVDVLSHFYYYRLVAIDECGFKTLSSNIASSILLNCGSSETEYTLEWNSYRTWLKGVDKYKVYRSVGDLPGNTIELTSTDPGTLTYSDPISSIDPTKKVCYWIKTNEKPGNTYFTNAVSLSNTCCIVKDHTLFLPNAFHPGSSKNYLFRPIWTYVNPLIFRMIIFNRWGQQLFETIDIDTGWDGYSKGLMVPPGLYAYIITYQDLKEKVFTKRGTVFVVR